MLQAMGWVYAFNEWQCFSKIIITGRIIPIWQDVFDS